MPLYEFQCPECGRVLEELRPLGHRDAEAWCESCEAMCPRIPSVPSLGIWNAERTFPNVDENPRAFLSKKAYEGFMKERGIFEVGIHAGIETPHGATVTRY
jgi:putative FmdB family regulatory protein